MGSDTDVLIWAAIAFMFALVSCGPPEDYVTAYGTRVYYAPPLEGTWANEAQTEEAQLQVAHHAVMELGADPKDLDWIWQRLYLTWVNRALSCAEPDCAGMYWYDQIAAWYRDPCLARTALVHELWHAVLVGLYDDWSHQDALLFGVVTQEINNEVQELCDG